MNGKYYRLRCFDWQLHIHDFLNGQGGIQRRILSIDRLRANKSFTNRLKDFFQRQGALSDFPILPLPVHSNQPNLRLTEA
jgi:hypothetical protein